MGRGPSPRDPKDFHAKQVTLLSSATFDLCFLFEQGYSESAALQLVGNRYQLRERQRLAILRSAASFSKLQERQKKHCSELANATLEIDGFNLVILLEAAVGGGVVFEGMDGCCRDLSSIHGNYRLVSQTQDVIRRAGIWMAQQNIRTVHWWFDAPVSNSGRLCALVRELAEQEGWNWTAQTSPHVDSVISQSQWLSVSSDKMVLQRCTQWNNLGASLIRDLVPDVWLIRLPQEEKRQVLMHWFQDLNNTRQT